MQPPDDTSPGRRQMFDTAGACAYLGRGDNADGTPISKSSLLRMRARGEIHATYISDRVVRYERADLDAYLDRQAGYQPRLPIPMPGTSTADDDPSKPKRGRPGKEAQRQRDAELQPLFLREYSAIGKVGSALLIHNIAETRLNRWLKTDARFATKYRRIERKWARQT